MSEFKNFLIKETSRQVSEYLDEKYCIDVDYLEIAEIINLNLRDILNKVTSEQTETI
jgi:hypothetical protein